MHIRGYRCDPIVNILNILPRSVEHARRVVITYRLRDRLFLSLSLLLLRLLRLESAGLLLLLLWSILIDGQSQHHIQY
jgi:hypothetical protein